MEFCVTPLKSNQVIIWENCTNKLVQLTRANLINFFRNLNYKFACKFVRAEFKCWNRHLKGKPPLKSHQLLKFSLVTSQQNVTLRLLPVRKTWPHLGVISTLRYILINLDQVQWPHWSQTTEAGVRQSGFHGRVWGREAPASSLSLHRTLAGFPWQHWCHMDDPGCIPGQENWVKTLKVWSTGTFRIFSLFSNGRS